MKILLQTRNDLFEKPGGDTRQIVKTKECLEKIGVQCGISAKLKKNLNNYQLVHLFNITRPYELFIQARQAKKYNKKIVLTPLYQNFDEWDKLGRHGVQKLFCKFVKNKNTKELIKNSLRFTKNKKLFSAVQRYKYTELQKRIIKMSDILIVNSKMEMEDIIEYFNIPETKFTVAYNGIDSSYQNTSPKLFVKKYHLNNFILSVANFSSIKNHINLIQAIKQTNLPLVLIGNKIKFHKTYYNKIKRAAKNNKNIIMLENVPLELIASAYAAAKVHILPSWFETCGLANLEAALAGANVVSTDRGYAREYFKNMAWYCDPSSTIAIKESILKAYEVPRSDKLKNYILENYNWGKTAEKILTAYKKVLAI